MAIYKCIIAYIFNVFNKIAFSQFYYVHSTSPSYNAQQGSKTAIKHVAKLQLWKHKLKAQASALHILVIDTVVFKPSRNKHIYQYHRTVGIEKISNLKSTLKTVRKCNLLYSEYC